MTRPSASRRTGWRCRCRVCAAYSDNLIEVIVEWCMSLDPLSRPQSVFALQKELSREGRAPLHQAQLQRAVKLQIDASRRVQP